MKKEECNCECKECCQQLGVHVTKPVIEHEHRWWSSSRKKEENCLICGLDWEKRNGTK